MRALFLLLAFITASLTGFAQCIATYTDINNQVYAFDGTQSKRIEEFPIQSFKIGKNIMAYRDRDGNLKVFYKSKVFKLNSGTSNYEVTDNWMVYSYNGVSKVLYNDEFKIIGEWPNSEYSSVSDSMIVINDRYHRQTSVFYNGEILLLDTTRMRNLAMGDNIIAYVDVSGMFKVFYHGQIQTIENYEPAKILADRDMVLYTDQYGNIKYFQNGNSYETKIPMPQEYWTGEGFGVYISPANSVMVFYNGTETSLINERPADLTVKENLLIYSDAAKNFWCWYKGTKYHLENYVPETYQADNDILVYRDINGRLKAFYYGEQIQISDQITDKFNLYNEAVTYSTQPYQTKVWCNKKTYTFE